MKIHAVANDPGGALPPLLQGDSWSSMRELLNLVSSRYGPVTRAGSYLGAGDAGGGALAGHAELLDLDGMLQDIYGQPSMAAGVNETLFGGGKGFSLGQVTLSTLGEAVERTVAALMSSAPELPSKRPIMSWREATNEGRNCVGPDDIHLFSDEQYARPKFLYEPFQRDTPIQWVAGRRLLSGAEVWVPAQLVDMVHIFHPNERMIGYPVSGGLACHVSYRDAVYGGLTEVFERDAVNISWYTKEPPEQVRLDATTREILGPFAERLECDHSDFRILRHRGGLTHADTFSIVGLQDWLPRRRYCAGGACDEDPATALRAAAVEYGQTRNTLSLSEVAPGSFVGSSAVGMFDWEPEWDLSRMTLFLQAIGYYGLPGKEKDLAHYFSGPVVSGDEAFPQRSPATGLSVEDKLGRLGQSLASSGIDPVVLDYTHPDWKHLSIVKVFIPELTTPFLQSRPMLGHPRLRNIRPGMELPHGHLKPLPYP